MTVGDWIVAFVAVCALALSIYKHLYAAEGQDPACRDGCAVECMARRDSQTQEGRDAQAERLQDKLVRLQKLRDREGIRG